MVDPRCDSFAVWNNSRDLHHLSAIHQSVPKRGCINYPLINGICIEVVFTSLGQVIYAQGRTQNWFRGLRTSSRRVNGQHRSLLLCVGSDHPDGWACKRTQGTLGRDGYSQNTRAHCRA